MLRTFLEDAVEANQRLLILSLEPTPADPSPAARGEVREESDYENETANAHLLVRDSGSAHQWADHGQSLQRKISWQAHAKWPGAPCRTWTGECAPARC